MILPFVLETIQIARNIQGGFMTDKVRKELKLAGTYVDEELHEQIYTQAKREERSMASLIRKAIKMYLRLTDNK